MIISANSCGPWVLHMCHKLSLVSYSCRVCINLLCMISVCPSYLQSSSMFLNCYGSSSIVSDFFLHSTGYSPLMAVMENTTWPHSSYVPHYLLRGDPFASRLSKEADIVAAFYICIIGQPLTERNLSSSFFFLDTSVLLQSCSTSVIYKIVPAHLFCLYVFLDIR